MDRLSAQYLGRGDGRVHPQLRCQRSPLVGREAARQDGNPNMPKGMRNLPYFFIYDCDDMA